MYAYITANITEQIIKAGKLLNIEIIDHIIIGDGIYTSFKKEEIIKKVER